jgi:uncharacterized protein (TIGR00251 family)
VIAVRAVGDGVEFLVRARPRAARDEVRGVEQDALAVSTTAPPERGRANDAIERTVAGFLGVKRAAVAIVSGGASRTKKVRVAGVTAREVQQKIAAIDGDKGGT